MTRKDYIIIARAFRDARPLSDAQTLTAKDALDNAARFLADTLAQDNARFDRARFLAACGSAS